ncbi:MAG: hypothetical protein WCR42_16220 [bacterium]
MGWSDGYTDVVITAIEQNPDQNPVTITGVESVDGKTQLILNGNNLNVHALPKASGVYQAKVLIKNATGGLDNAILSGNIITDSRIVVYPFTAPNDSTFDYLGSGRIFKNHKELDDMQLARLDSIIAGTFTDPTDKRLLYRADLNADGAINSIDRAIFVDVKNGKRVLPSDWNKLTYAEQLDWTNKTFENILKPYFYPFVQSSICNQYSNQLMIDNRGFNQSDLSTFLKVYPYNVDNNGLVNIPMYEVLVNSAAGSHLMNAILIGNDARVFSNWCFIEPQRKGGVNIKPGQFYFPITSRVSIRSPPINYPGDGTIGMVDGLLFNIDNGVATLNPYTNSNVNWIYTK